MEEERVQIPDELIDALKEHQVIPFIGAGASRAVEKKVKDTSKTFEPLFPNWKEFLEHSVKKLNLKKDHDEADDIKQLLALKKPMYLEAAKRASKALGETPWQKLLKEKLDLEKANADEESLKLSQFVWELGSNLLITTNVDRVLQWTCPNPQEIRLLDMEKAEIGELLKEKEVKYPTVLYLHGRIHNKRNVVFTPEQYENFYEKGNNKAKLQALLNLLTSHTTLFIGFSMDDEYFLKQLNYIDEIYESGANSFYILIAESEKDNPNIPKYVEKIIYPHHGKPLLDLLERMKKIANGENDSDDSKPPQPPDLPPVKRELLTTTSPTLSVTFSSTQKVFKSTLAEKHFNVPFASKGNAFVGRTGLREKIWESLDSGRRTAIGQAINIKGIGGLGKTQLAVEYAHDFRKKYENGVFWITADEDINVQLIKIGEDLNWISQFDKGFDQAELVRNRFRKLSDCLIIFDNVVDQKSIKDYLPAWDTKTHILITSQKEQDNFYPINLDILNSNEARKLLIEVAEREPETDAEKKALENISTELDGLPLAIELVGGYLFRRENISFQDYFQYLENEPLESLEKRFPDESFTRHDKSIIRTLKISEKLLSQTPHLEQILDILAWSGKFSMGYSLLRELVGTNDNLALKDALGVALELHFIKKEENEERYAIHRLLAKVRQFEKPLKTRKEWHRKVVNSLERWFREKDDESKTLTEAELELDHLEVWEFRTREHLPAYSVWLTLLKANPLIERGNYQEAQKYTEEAYNIYQEEDLSDKTLLANLYFAMYAPINYLGDFKKASEFIEKGLDIYKKFFIDDKKLLTNLLAGLASIYGSLGNHQKALELQQNSLEIEKELFEEKHPYVANSLNNLGSTYGELGDNQKALELKQKALNIYQELFGEKHPSVATSLNNLGSTYGKLGDYQKALEFQQKALKIRQELFGEQHPDVANSLNNLGSTYGNLGNHPKALELQERALEIYRELFGEKHPDVALSLNNIGWTQSRLGNHSKAVEYYQKALQIQREIFGNHHPNTLLFCENLILELVESGFQEKAGRLAGEFLSYVPQDHRFRPIFEKYGAMYRKANQRKKKRRH